MRLIALLAVLPHYPEPGLGIGVGDPGAPVRVIEFLDYQCPYCQAFALRVFPYVEPLIEQGKVYWIFADLPLTSIHPYALPAARVAVCVGYQTRPDFLTFHKAMMRSAVTWSSIPDPVGAMMRVALDAGANGDMLQECLASGRADAFLQATVNQAQEFGITGTPAFWINGTLWQGFLDVDGFFRIYRRVVSSTDNRE